MKLANFMGILLLFEACLFVNTLANTINNDFPMIMITWDYKNATEKGILTKIFNCVNFAKSKRYASIWRFKGTVNYYLIII